MGSSRARAELIAEQAGAAARAMFGEYGLYRDGILVALVCDDRLYLKPTAAGRADPGLTEEAPPYPGAKPHLVVPEAVWQDGERLSRLFRDTAAALPPAKEKPKPKRKPSKPAKPV